MKQRIWIINHYATDQLFRRAGRHYWFAKYLHQLGYSPTIFCCNVKHNNDGFFFPNNDSWTIHETPDGFSSVVIGSTPYTGNGLSRIRNMVVFSWNLLRTTTEYAKQHGKPDVILASSVHPLTVIVGEWIARKMKVPCIAEIRDLWPESIFAFYPEKKSGTLAALLYAGERWMYKRADAIIFTMEGGKDYLSEKGWTGTQKNQIHPSKVFHINNGVDLESNRQNLQTHYLNDSDLDDESLYKVVYTGSLGRANSMGLMLDTAKLLTDSNVCFLVWGEGPEAEALIERCKMEKIENVVFKGAIDRRFVPSILARSDLNFFVLEDSSLYRYGLSLNKSFEYLASGKPMMIVGNAEHTVFDEYACGIHIKNRSAEAFADGIRAIQELPPGDYEELCLNSIAAAKAYDVRVLTSKLRDIIERVE